MTSATIPDRVLLREVEADGFVLASHRSARPRPAEVPVDVEGPLCQLSTWELIEFWE